MQTGTTVRVGEVIRYTCRAVDPQGRPIHWRLSTPCNHVVVADGADVELEWIVADNDVAQQGVGIYMATEGPHHRIKNSIDGRVFFFYMVLPPSKATPNRARARGRCDSPDHSLVRRRASVPVGVTSAPTSTPVRSPCEGLPAIVRVRVRADVVVLHRMQQHQGHVVGVVGHDQLDRTRRWMLVELELDLLAVE